MTLPSAGTPSLRCAALIAAVVFGRPPRDGGTGKAYNPQLTAEGDHKVDHWIELGAGITQASGEPWPEWDDASQDARAEATLLYQHGLYQGLSEDAAITAALATTPLSAGARAILESMRDGARFTVPTEEE